MFFVVICRLSSFFYQISYMLISCLIHVFSFMMCFLWLLRLAGAASCMRNMHPVLSKTDHPASSSRQPPTKQTKIQYNQFIHIIYAVYGTAITQLIVQDRSYKHHMTWLSAIYLYYMGVSINGGSPKWMVCKGKSYYNCWFRGTPICGNLHICVHILLLWYVSRAGDWCLPAQSWALALPSGGKVKLLQLLILRISGVWDCSSSKWGMDA